MLLGIWKSFDELEENVGLDELNLILKAAHKKEHRRNRFMAALKGHNIDEPENTTSFEDVQRRAEAKLAGKDVEELEFADLGIDFETG